METLPPDTRTLRLVSHNGTRYDAEIRERVRESWFWLDGRNAEAVARRMQAQCPGLDARTIRRWATDEGWAAWGEEHVAELAPGIHRSVVVELIAGAHEAAVYIRNASRGTAIASPARVNAANSLLDRAGFKARDTVLAPVRPRVASSAEERPRTPADIEELLRRRLDESRHDEGA